MFLKYCIESINGMRHWKKENETITLLKMCITCDILDSCLESEYFTRQTHRQLLHKRILKWLNDCHGFSAILITL